MIWLLHLIFSEIWNKIFWKYELRLQWWYVNHSNWSLILRSIDFHPLGFNKICDGVRWMTLWLKRQEIWYREVYTIEATYSIYWEDMRNINKDFLEKIKKIMTFWWKKKTCNVWNEKIKKQNKTVVGIMKILASIVL